MLFADTVFNIFAGVFMFSMMFVKTSLLFCCFCIRFFQTSMLLFVSVCCYAKARCYYSCPYAVMRKLDAIIRVRMLLCESLMLLFVSVCCYAKPRCYYVRLNPGLQRARPLWSGASDKLIMPILPAERKFMLLSEVARKLSWNIWNNLPRQTWILIVRNQFLIVLKLCITQL